VSINYVVGDGTKFDDKPVPKCIRVLIKLHIFQIHWDKSARDLHNFIRGNDKVPGAWAMLNGEKVTFYDSSLYKADTLPDDVRSVAVSNIPGGHVFAHRGGLLIPAVDNKYVRMLI
jgi:formyltetrahydrofolate dehydrogenase